MQKQYVVGSIVSGLMMLAQSYVAAAPPAHLFKHGPATTPIATPSLPPTAAPAAAAAASPPAAATHGLSQAASKTARTTNGYSRASGSLSRVPPGAAAKIPGTVPTAPTVNRTATGHALQSFDAVQAAAQQTLDNRLRQADHLSEIAKQNGNPQLAETADRLRVEARQQYDAAVARIQSHATTTDADTVPAQPPADSTMPHVPASVPPAARTGWRDRFHFATPFRR
jgi:hypothetical protein